MFRMVITAVVIVVAAPVGCGDGDSDPVHAPETVAPEDAPASAAPETASGAADEDDPGPPPPPPPQCAGVRVVRIDPWPGRGVQVTFEADVDDEPTLTRGEETVASVTLPTGETAGLTAVALAPGGAGELETRRLQARALIEALPTGERIGLWVAEAGGLTMHAELTTRRGHVLERLDAVAPGEATVDQTRLDELREALRGVQHGIGPVHRDVVVVDGSSPVEVASVLARRAAVRRLGACPDVVEGDALTLRVGDAECLLEAPEPWLHLLEQPCDPAAAAADDYPYGAEIALELTEEQRAVYDQRTAAGSKEDFVTTVTLGGSGPIAATAHLRGQSSLGCPRKSFTVNLAGGRARRLAPGATEDKFHLISLCLDDRYYKLMLSNRIMGPLGIYPLDVRFVRLRIAGANAGVYLFIEDVTDTLISERVATGAVIRRRFDPEDKPEDVKHPPAGADADAALAAYESLAALVDSEPPEALLVALSERIDLDNYLRWLALMTFLQNGDYVDEAFFFGSTEAAGGLYFRHLGWDSDDLLASCHHGGKFALQDPFGILYCAEADLDHALLASPEVYARFVDHLELLMTDTLAPGTLAALLDGVRAELFAVLADDDTAAAMVELVEKNPAASTAVGAQADIAANMEAFLATVEQRRAELTAKIAAYRAGRP